MLSSIAQTPNWKWVKVSNEKNSDNDICGYAISSDLNANTYVLMEYDAKSTLNLDTFSLNSTNWENIYLLKYNLSGKLIWAKNINGYDYIQGYSIYVDSKANIYISGSFHGYIKFDSIILTVPDSDQENLFVAKYDSIGKFLWAKKSLAQKCIASSVTADNDGNVYVTGGFEGPVVYFDDDDSLINNAGCSMYLLKYSASGKVIWTKKADGNNYDFGRGVVSNSNGDIYVTGAFSSNEIYFDSIKLTNNGASDMFIAKYNSDGKVIWAIKAGGSDGDYPMCIATDKDDNVNIAGDFHSYYCNFGDTMINGSGTDTISNIFIAQYNKFGEFKWVQRPRGFHNAVIGIGGITCDLNSNVYISGGFISKAITFGNTTLFNHTEISMFIAKFNSFGKNIWAKSAVSYGKEFYNSDISSGVTSDNNGDVCVTGKITSDSTFFDNWVVSTVGKRFFVGKLSENPNGINDQENKTLEQIILYPNPSENIIFVNIPGNYSTIEIINLNGQVVKKVITQNKLNQIDISNLNSSIYLIKVSDEKGISTAKFIKL